MISQCIQQMAMKILKENPNIANNPNPYANYGFGCYCGSTNNGCC